MEWSNSGVELLAQRFCPDFPFVRWPGVTERLESHHPSERAEALMVSKCANPECSAQFRYLHQGQLFQRDTLPLDQGDPSGRRHVEFFWLCEECSTKMTLVYSKERGVTAQRLNRARAQRAGS